MKFSIALYVLVALACLVVVYGLSDPELHYCSGHLAFHPSDGAHGPCTEAITELMCLRQALGSFFTTLDQYLLGPLYLAGEIKVDSSGLGVGGKVHPPPLLYFFIDSTINVSINQSHSSTTPYYVLLASPHCHISDITLATSHFNLSILPEQTSSHRYKSPSPPTHPPIPLIL
ncbi:hypothetical protein E2C01_055078 [Portunus trituberculatus]|uniref:Uncharacterized protein n=1 Tax=Portunus trituberculatus TaxID=210409 RepID=A0A5B7GTU7_PORTR|nr:hypothetical protein [Portunus trituberculatus]